jgi:predicted solute-binding protein
MMSAAPYVVKAANMAVAGSSDGKNSGPMMVAKTP